MKRILGLILLLFLSSLPLFAAKNSQEFEFSADLRVGDVQLPKGHCDVTWTVTSGESAQLTIKTRDRKTITIPARMVEGHSQIGVGTYVVDGITYLEALHTANYTFIVHEPPSNPK